MSVSRIHRPKLGRHCACRCLSIRWCWAISGTILDIVPSMSLWQCIYALYDVIQLDRWNLSKSRGILSVSTTEYNRRLSHDNFCLKIRSLPNEKKHVKRNFISRQPQDTSLVKGIKTIVGGCAANLIKRSSAPSCQIKYTVDIKLQIQVHFLFMAEQFFSLGNYHVVNKLSMWTFPGKLTLNR